MCVIHSNELDCLRCASLEFVIRNLQSRFPVAHFRFVFQEDVMIWKINAFRHANVNYILRLKLYHTVRDRQVTEL